MPRLVAGFREAHHKESLLLVTALVATSLCHTVLGSSVEKISTSVGTLSTMKLGELKAASKVIFNSFIVLG